MYHLSVFIHTLCAIFWIGGMLFTAAVLVPACRHRLLKNKKGTLFTIVGKKFSRISWLLFIVLVITGITNLLARGYTLSSLMTADFWNSNLGSMLSYKLTLFAAVLIVSGVHDFYAGPKAAQLMDQQPKSAITNRMRKVSSRLGAGMFGLQIYRLQVEGQDVFVF